MIAIRKSEEKESSAESVLLDCRRFLELSGAGMLAGLVTLFGAAGCGGSAGDGDGNDGGDNGGGGGNGD